MIFAHGPLGWLSAGWIRRIWSRAELTKAQGWWMVVIGGIGGLFPDIDLFYFHFVSAEVSHRQLPTHTVLFYLPVVVLVMAVARWRKAWFAYGAVWCFSLGILTHLITDSVGGAIMWLWPFVTQPYGLFSIPTLAQSAHASRLFLYNFLMEGVWLSLFIFLWGPKIFRSTRAVLWKWLAPVFLLTWSGLFILIFQHTTHLPAGLFYGDADADQVINLADADLDGDGLNTAEDPDVDGDGIDNASDVAQAAQSFIGVWADPTQNNLAQILTRMGFLTNGHAVNRAFASAGFFWREEMSRDYEERADGYISSPAAPDFETQTENRLAYFSHHTSIQIQAQEIPLVKVGDVIFFTTGEPEGIVVAVNEEAVQVVRTQTGQGTKLKIIPLEQLVETVMVVGRVWP